MKTINESGMDFCIWKNGLFFDIESAADKNTGKENVKIADFLYLKNKSIWIVEAKSSFPVPDTNDFRANINAIEEKFINSISIFFASLLERHKGIYSKMPPPFQQLDKQTVNIKFYLVINGHDDDGLEQIASALRESLKGIAKAWNLSLNDYIIVLNEKMAQDKCLVI